METFCFREWRKYTKLISENEMDECTVSPEEVSSLEKASVSVSFDSP